MWNGDARPDRAFVDSPRRRRVVLGAFGTLLAAGSPGIGHVAGQDNGVRVSMESVFTTAWKVTAVEGPEDVAPTGEENPTLTLQVGTRYTFENPGWNFHPLAFRDENDNPLLSQRGRGQFEDDGNVDWVDEDETIVFTLTEGLAERLDDYVCVLHSRMNGPVQVDGLRETPAAAVTFPEQTIDESTVRIDSVRMDDGGFVTVHDDGLLDGDAIGSVVGVSEYLGPGSYEGVTVDIDGAIAEEQTLVAMPHRDTNDNDNEAYDVVATEVVRTTNAPRTTIATVAGRRVRTIAVPDSDR